MDEGQLGRPPVIKEFPPLTKEDLEEIRKLEMALLEKFGHQYGDIPGMEVYTGVKERVGYGTAIINSPMTFHQLVYALAFTRHALIKDISRRESDLSKFDAKILVDNKIMDGIKILDMGCSNWPVFARCCRAMSADIWTIDKTTKPFHFDPELFTPEQQKVEIAHHIQLDLESPQSIEIIKQKTGGNFNLVTESQLVADEFAGGKQIALGLLKKGGVHTNGFYESLKE